MDDSKLLRQLRRGNPQALEEAIAKYSAYVMAVIRNRSRGLLTPEDHEEIASDVFLALWRSGAQISPRSPLPAPLVGVRGPKPHGGLDEKAPAVCAPGAAGH